MFWVCISSRAEGWAISQNQIASFLCSFRRKQMVAKSTSTTARDVDDYLSRLPEDSRAALEQLRQTIKSIVPEAIEVISYQIPTFKYQGRMLVSYAAFKKHLSFFPGAAPIEAHRNELKSYQTSKGTIRFPIDKPLPAALVKKLVKARIKENEQRRTAYAKR
jgi:uncharacterized protein YdhG (YjbR/CyaY superfamily)